ncbi:hypothetical protein CRG98_033805 [Punica granatum]|uniref:Uncharacterized protein n=1 Tax=Punica granatum TaxID=22663 RepID=A0A2I0IP71_PUNGR|nr:hypothetical protein CRG98_033805 [Punica granatum]
MTEFGIKYEMTYVYVEADRKDSDDYHSWRNDDGDHVVDGVLHVDGDADINDVDWLVEGGEDDDDDDDDIDYCPLAEGKESDAYSISKATCYRTMSLVGKMLQGTIYEHYHLPPSYVAELNKRITNNRDKCRASADELRPRIRKRPSEEDDRRISTMVVGIWPPVLEVFSFSLFELEGEGFEGRQQHGTSTRGKGSGGRGRERGKGVTDLIDHRALP